MIAMVGKTRAVAIALIALQFMFVAAYITHERTIYFWDHAMYFNMARQLFEISSQNFSDGWEFFRQSLANNYNLIFALPSLFTFSLFDSTRLVFILTNFAVFFVGYEWAVAFFLRRTLDLKWRTAVVMSLATALLIPPLWLPLLEGYPDSGAAAFIVLAAALGWKNSRSWPSLVKQGLIIGVTLAGAVLLRRHFVYPAIALIITLGCVALLDIAKAGKNRWREFWHKAVYFGCCGFGFLVIFVLIAPDFLQAALTVNYGDLYLSYTRPALVFIRFVLGGFGLGLLAIAGGGLYLLAQRGAGGRRLAVFIALFTFLWLVVWCAGPDQMGHHYILHILPLFISAGLTGWLLILPQKLQQKKYLYVVLLVFLVANSLWALWLSPTGVWPNDNGRLGLLAAPRPPVVRDDYAEWKRLAEYVAQTTKPGDRIMMVGSSFVFNQDLMHSVYTDLLDRPDTFLNFVRAPEIDHEEPAPLDAFASANIYLVPDPPQYHLDPGGQKVVTAAAKQFPPPPERAIMFHKDDELFHLADGVTVTIWRREDWKPDVLHDALDEIRKDGPQDIGLLQDWAATAMPLRTQIRTNRQGSSYVGGLFDQEHKNLNLFFLYPVAEGNARLAFHLRTDCVDPQFRLTLITGDGQGRSKKDFVPATTNSDQFQDFSVPSAEKQNLYVQLNMNVKAAALCRAELLNLRVEKEP